VTHYSTPSSTKWTLVYPVPSLSTGKNSNVSLRIINSSQQYTYLYFVQSRQYIFNQRPLLANIDPIFCYFFNSKFLPNFISSFPYNIDSFISYNIIVFECYLIKKNEHFFSFIYGSKNFRNDNIVKLVDMNHHIVSQHLLSNKLCPRTLFLGSVEIWCNHCPIQGSQCYIVKNFTIHT